MNLFYIDLGFSYFSGKIIFRINPAIREDKQGFSYKQKREHLLGTPFVNPKLLNDNVQWNVHKVVRPCKIHQFLKISLSHIIFLLLVLYQ